MNMKTIDRIKARLDTIPRLGYKVDKNSVYIYPLSRTGFTVYLTVNDPGFTVGFDGWHEDFDDEDEALDIFAFGQSDR